MKIVSISKLNLVLNSTSIFLKLQKMQFLFTVDRLPKITIAFCNSVNSFFLNLKWEFKLLISEARWQFAKKEYHCFIFTRKIYSRQSKLCTISNNLVLHSIYFNIPIRSNTYFDESIIFVGLQKQHTVGQSSKNQFEFFCWFYWLLQDCCLYSMQKPKT